MKHSIKLLVRFVSVSTLVSSMAFAQEAPDSPSESPVTEPEQKPEPGSESTPGSEPDPDSGTGSPDSEMSPSGSETSPSDSETGSSDSEIGPPDSEVGPPDSEKGPPDSETGSSDSETGPPDSEVGPPGSETGSPDSEMSPSDSEMGSPDSETVPDAEPEAPPAEPLPDEEEPTKLVPPFARQGQFLALGLHYSGAAADDADRGWRQYSQGPAFNLRLGEAIVDWADIGLEFGLGLGGGEEKLTTGRILAHTRLYPHERLFVHAGFGFGFAGGPDPEFEGFQRFRYGDVYVLGLGTNLYLKDRNRSGGPILSPVASFEIGPDDEFTTVNFWAGLEISWWGGLSPDKLDLPIERAYEPEDD